MNNPSSLNDLLSSDDYDTLEDMNDLDCHCTTCSPHGWDMVEGGVVNDEEFE